MAKKQIKVKPELIQKQDNPKHLPANLKSGIENLSGIAMDDVKVHYNSTQPNQLKAQVYTQGSAIHLASAQNKHLPNEAWHVVQQQHGRIKPIAQVKDEQLLNDEKDLEREADRLGEQAKK